MGLVMKIGVKMRKSVVMSIRTCYRSVGNHPFLVSMLLFLIIVQRSFPFVFSLLVSISPVFVYCAVLLGTLLIFGQSNEPEREKEHMTTNDIDIASFRTGVSSDDIVFVQNDRIFSSERVSEKAREAAENSEVEDYEGSVGYVSLIDESLQPIQSEKRSVEEIERKTHDEKLTKDDLVQKFDDAHKDKGDYLEPSVGGSGADEEDFDESDETSDSEFDQLESSSPDASMADIFPILDELHPLLELEAPMPAHMSQDDSGAASDRSNDGSNETDEDIQNQKVEIEEAVHDNDGDEEEAQGGKDDESKSAIKWTEDDQKNLTDLGNLELERNQHLESLIARRRSTKNFSLSAEKNLIDFDGSENPFNVTPISTKRNNPFDPQYDSSYDSMGLPPIPGSAPSILLPRRNPFQLPYESSQENPQLKGDPFEQGFMPFQPRDNVFCRHESFSLGPSGFGDFKWRPVFMPKPLGPEGTSYSSLQRQSSDVSDSKLSSGPDTETVSSAADLDDRKFSEQDFTKEAEVISNIYHAYDLVGPGSQSSEDVDSLETEPAGKRDTVQHDELEIKLSKVKNQEPSLSGARGLLATPVEITKEESSTRSSLSSLSEMDEKTSDMKNVGPTSSESRSDLVVKVEFSPQPPLEESQVQFTSGMVDDHLHKEPIYDSSPTASEKILSFDSISSDMREEILKLIPKTEADVDHPKILDVKEASSNLSDQHFSSSKEKPPSEPEKDLSESDKSMGEPRFDDHNELHEPIIILPLSKEDSSTIQDVNVLKVPEVQDPGLENLSSVTSKSPSIKEIASRNTESGVKEPTTTHSALKQVSEGNVGELPNPSDSMDGSTNVETNAVAYTMEIQPRNTGSTAQENITTQSSLKEVSEGNISELPKQSNPKCGPVKVGTDGAGSKHEIASNSTGSGVEEGIAPDIELKQISEGNVRELPKPSDSKNGSEKAKTNAAESTKPISSSNTEYAVEEHVTGNITMKKVSEGNVGKPPEPLNSEVNNGELSKSSSSKDGSHKMGTSAVGSMDGIASSKEGSSVQDTVTSYTTLKQVSDDTLGELQKPSDSKVGSKKVGTGAVSSTKDIAPSNAGSGVHETNTTDTAMKQVSEDNAVELPKLSNSMDTALKQVSKGNEGELPKQSDSKGRSTLVGTKAAGSVKEVSETNAGSGDQETITNHTALKQVPEGNHGELSKPTDSLKKEGTGLMDTKEVSTSHAGSGTQETITTHTDLKQVSEGKVGDLPKPSNLKDGSEKMATSAVGSTNDITSTDSALKQVSEGNVGELPKPLDSKDGSTKVGINVVGSNNEVLATNAGSGVQETFTKQVPKGNNNEVSKPSSSKDVSIKEGNNAASSTNEIGSSNIESGVDENTTTSLMPVSEGKLGELPKPLELKYEVKKVGTNVVDSTEDNASSNTGSSVQENFTTHTGLKQISESNEGEIPKASSSKDESTKGGTNAMDSTNQNIATTVGELPELSDSKDVSTKLGTNAVDSTMETSSLSKTGSGVQETITIDTSLKTVSEGNVKELPKHANENDDSTNVGTSAAGSTKEIRPNNTKSGVPDSTRTGLKQVLEGNLSELLNPSNSEVESTEVGTNVVGSTKEIPSSNTGSSIRDTIITHSPSNEVSEGNLSELLKASDSKDESAKEGTNASSNVTTNTTFKQVSEDTNAGELSKPSNLKNESENVETNAVGTTKEEK